MLDIYPVQVPTKFGHVWFRPEHIIITSSRHPRLWYDYLQPRNRLDEFAALRRRITKVLDFDNKVMCSPHARVPSDITDVGWDTDFVYV